LVGVVIANTNDAQRLLSGLLRHRAPVYMPVVAAKLDVDVANFRLGMWSSFMRRTKSLPTDGPARSTAPSPRGRDGGLSLRAARGRDEG
jgi:hypothetical protein